MASTYKRVRLGKTQRMMGRAKITSAIGEGLMLSGGGVAVVGGFIPALAVIAAGSLLSAGASGAMRGLRRTAMRQQVMSRLISNAQVAKRQTGASASIARARGTLARTAAARSAAASRSVVRRPIGQRLRDNANKASSDGQTKSYYRMQGGKRVLVRGYATPQR